MEADWQSRNPRDSSEWKLLAQIFHQICQIKRTPEIDLFASRLSYQLPKYFAWRPDPYSEGTDAMQNPWGSRGKREGAKTQLLLGYIKRHAEVSSSTVSWWIKETLKLSGIDVTTFKGHSTRVASSSKVGSIGLSVSNILNRGSWSQKSTWQRFYDKLIISGNEAYQKSALG